MGDKSIRVGIIGAGGNTILRHIPGLRAIDGVEIVSVCSRSRQSSQRVPQGTWRVEEEFIAAIRGTETIRYTTFDTGVKVMHITEAVARSQSSGNTVALL